MGASAHQAATSAMSGSQGFMHGRAAPQQQSQLTSQPNTDGPGTPNRGNQQVQPSVVISPSGPVSPHALSVFLQDAEPANLRSSTPLPRALRRQCQETSLLPRPVKSLCYSTTCIPNHKTFQKAFDSPRDSIRPVLTFLISRNGTWKSCLAFMKSPLANGRSSLCRRSSNVM